jgi:transposase
MSESTQLNERQYAYLQIFLPPVKTSPMEYDYFDILSGILYFLRTSCTWRDLPPHFPPWSTVYYHFRKLIETGFWQKILLYINKLIRIKEGLAAISKRIIIDSQTIESTKTCGTRGIDGNKCIKGIKKHKMTDDIGLEIDNVTTPANVGDREGCLLLLMKNRHLLQEIVEIIFDGIYTGDKFHKQIKAILPKAKITVVPRLKARGFVPIPERYPIERTNGIHEDYHRLWKGVERLQKVNDTVCLIADVFTGLRRLTKGKTKKWLTTKRR